MSSSRDARSEILIFLACTAALSLAFAALILCAGVFGAAGGLYALGLAWSPALAALIACHVRDRSLASFGWAWAPSWIRPSIGLPWMYAGGVTALLWSTGLAGFPNWRFIERITSDLGFGGAPAVLTVSVWVVVAATLGVLRAATGVLGEEMGWRGFLVPALTRLTTPTRAMLLSGLAWTAWCLPVALLMNYHQQVIGTAGVLWYALTALSLGVLLAWVRLRSESLWPAVTLHAVHDVLVQSILTPLTVLPRDGARIAGEFGPALAVATTLVTVVVVLRWHPVGRRVDPRHALGSAVADVLVRSTAPQPAASRPWASAFAPARRDRPSR